MGQAKLAQMGQFYVAVYIARVHALDRVDNLADLCREVG